MLAHHQLIAASLICAAAVFWLSSEFAETELQRLMAGLQGRQNYEVTQQNQPVGYLATQTLRNADGNWVMTQDLSINMLNAPAYTSSQSMIFAGTTPYPLLSAQFAQHQQSGLQRVSLAKTPQGYNVNVERNGSSEQVVNTWEFTLTDQLGLERQLSMGSKTGDMIVSQYLDLQALAISQRQQTLIKRDADGYTLRSADDSETQLDPRLQLIRFSAPHRFSFRRTTDSTNQLNQRAASRAIRWTDQTAIAPLTKDLVAPAAMTELTLALTPLGDFSLQKQGLPATLGSNQSLKARTTADPTSLSASLNLPVRHPKIQRLLIDNNAPAGATVPELARHFIDLTRRQLLYTANQPAGSVLAALQSGRGECVDFADLLTTLARSQGIPSRTVYGVAYSALPNPGFRFHAWNEIWFEERWYSLDPTWDQSIADATHIPLDDQTLAALANAMQQKSVALTPVQWTYSKAAVSPRL